ncbi:transketolase [Candidatus Peregrinibacteria bacterium]|nr:transketolase [Candidatus Peregrinibacteria bacterium]
MLTIPSLSNRLSKEHLSFLQAFSKSCRHSIIAMLQNAQSGHPGGSLSSIDYLSLLYSYIISQTAEQVIISNGHISPAVYSVLAELNVISKEELIRTFRKKGSIFEGHITRHVDGVQYGTGPLGIGVSAAAGQAWAEKYHKTNKRVFSLMGDGEVQEGQVHEMMHFAAKYQLDNLILFVDYNRVQLTGSLEETMPLDIAALFQAAGWHVLHADGHDYQELWKSLETADAHTKKPTVIIGKTIMGKGVPGMEQDGLDHKSTWHGKAPKPEEAETMLEELNPTVEELSLIEQIHPIMQWKPKKNEYPRLLSETPLSTGIPVEYEAGTVTDCRSAYGKALLDLAQNNNNIVALTADLRGSVKTAAVADNLPDQHIECGIAEQHMVSCAGGLSFMEMIPFTSTFGAFLTSRAKDQARVNDINYTNVKMVATHCGLSVGEDGPTHQAIDDMGSFLGLFNTMVIEPADANQTDRIIRYIASHYGNFYVRMGRHKFPVITKENGSPYYDKQYKYRYGKTDIIRSGSDITIAATGAMVGEALKAYDMLKKSNPKLSIEIVAISSIKEFDDTIVKSVRKTKKLLTVEDHNIYSGLGTTLPAHISKKHIELLNVKSLGVTEYQLSGKSHELYDNAGISASHIAKSCTRL